MTLAELKPGHRARILEVGGTQGVAQRLTAFGLLPGTPVLLVGVAPMGDPITLGLRGQHLSIRRADATHIKVELEGGEA